MRKTLLGICLLLSYFSYSQSSLIKDSVLKPVRVLLNDSSFGTGGSDYNRLDLALATVCNEDYTTIYYRMLNQYPVKKPTEYGELRYRLLNSIYEQVLQEELIKMPELTPLGRKVADTIAGEMCKYIETRENYDSYFHVKEEQEAVEFATKKLVQRAVIKAMLEKAVLQERNNIMDISNGIDWIMLENCRKFAEKLQKLGRFTGQFPLASYTLSYNHVGRYYKKMIGFYKDKNFESLAIKFPEYKKYETVLKTIAGLTDAYQIESSQLRTLKKLTTGKWTMTEYISNEKLEDKNKYFGKLIFTFNELDAKPIIAAIQYVPALPHETIIPQQEFIARKKRGMPDLPPLPPPPPPPPSFDEPLSKEALLEIERIKNSW